MTPSVPEIIRGCTIALATPAPPESAGDFAAGRVGLVSMLLGLSAQEANRCVGATIAENADIRALFAACGDAATATPRLDPPAQGLTTAFFTCWLVKNSISLSKRILGGSDSSTQQLGKVAIPFCII